MLPPLAIKWYVNKLTVCYTARTLNRPRYKMLDVGAAESLSIFVLKKK